MEGVVGAWGGWRLCAEGGPWPALKGEHQPRPERPGWCHVEQGGPGLRNESSSLAWQWPPDSEPKNKHGSVVWGCFHRFSAESSPGPVNPAHCPSRKIPLSSLQACPAPVVRAPRLLSPLSDSGPDSFLLSIPGIHSGPLGTPLHPCCSFSFLSSLPFFFF